MIKNLTHLIGLGLLLFTAMASADEAHTDPGDAKQRSLRYNIAFQNALRAQRSDEFELAQKLWDELKKPEDRPEVLNNLAALAHAQDQNARALQLLQQASKLSPHYASIQHNIQQLSRSDVTEEPQRKEGAKRLQLIEAPPARGIPVRPNPSRGFATNEFHSASFSQTPDGYIAEQQAIIKKYMPSQPDLVNEPTDNLEHGNVAEIKKALHVWRASWMKRDVGRYFASYDISFTPQDGLSHIKWKLARCIRIEASQNIEITISDLQVDLDLTAANGRTRFVQHYRSALFQDKVIKTLQWKKRDGIWYISSESTQPV